MAFERCSKNSKYQFTALQADINTVKPPVAPEVGDICITDLGNEYIFRAGAWQEHRMRYKDLGLVIDATNVPAGATVMSAIFTGLQWVRNARYLGACDQTHSVFGFPRDSSSVESGISALGASAQPSTGGANTFRAYTLTSAASTASSGVFGHGVRFQMKNEGASVASYAKMRVQLFD